jgi:Mg/Co/Ni transporter MgtE
MDGKTEDPSQAGKERHIYFRTNAREVLSERWPWLVASFFSHVSAGGVAMQL